MGSLQLYPTVCDPVDCGLPCFSVQGIHQARILEWVAIPLESTIFLAALGTNSPEYLMLPEPLQPKQQHHLHTWHSLGQTQVLRGSLRSKPQCTIYTQRWR